MKLKVSGEWTEQNNGQKISAATEIVWTKTVPLNSYHRIIARTSIVLKYTHLKIMINEEDYF